ncbi:MAG: hypothetical protein JEZ05_00995 [Tenericutes bacterium]|nr:hypothetical protein [Mycoplasmatota bacterium]
MKKSTNNLLSFILIIFGIAVVIMIFLPTLSFPDSDSSFLGYEVAFGTEFVNLGSFASGQINWSILAILGFVFPLIASLITMYYKKIKAASIALFAAGAVLLITMPIYTQASITVLGTVTDIDIEWVITYGLIMAIVFAMFGLLLSIYMFINKK